MRGVGQGSGKRTNGIITVPPTHTKTHTRTRSLRIRRSKRRLNIVYDMRYATPKKKQQQATKRTSWFGLSCTESVNASVQFVRSSIAVAGSAARTCLIHLRVVGSGRVASTELGYWVKTAQQQQQINKNYESTANAILQTQHDETDADLTWHMA